MYFPLFRATKTNGSDAQCLLQCLSEDCFPRMCCDGVKNKKLISDSMPQPFPGCNDNEGYCETEMPDLELANVTIQAWRTRISDRRNYTFILIFIRNYIYIIITRFDYLLLVFGYISEWCKHRDLNSEVLDINSISESHNWVNVFSNWRWFKAYS